MDTVELFSTEGTAATVSLPIRRCILAGKPHRSPLREISEFLAIAGFSITYARNQSEVIGSLISEADSYDLCVVAIEDMGGISRVFRGMRNIRISYPSLPVIIISEKSHYDDFGIERLPLADVSIRETFAPGMLIGAIIQSSLNNRVWRERQNGVN